MQLSYLRHLIICLSIRKIFSRRQTCFLPQVKNTRSERLAQSNGSNGSDLAMLYCCQLNEAELSSKVRVLTKKKRRQNTFKFKSHVAQFSLNTVKLTIELFLHCSTHRAIMRQRCLIACSPSTGNEWTRLAMTTGTHLWAVTTSPPSSVMMSAPSSRTVFKQS